MTARSPARRPGRTELLALFALLLFALAVYFGAKRLAPAGARAIVEENGREVCAVELASLTEPKTVEVRGVRIELSAAGAWVVASDCPDALCVKAGLLSRAGESAVCLPNRVSVRILGGAPRDADAVTG